MNIKNNKHGFANVMEQSGVFILHTLDCFNLTCFNFKSLSWEVCNSNPNNWTFKFIKIYAKMVKVLWYLLLNKKTI
jgi:hypothetical protein